MRLEHSTEWIWRFINHINYYYNIIINGQKKSFEMYAVNIKISMTEYHHLINRSSDDFTHFSQPPILALHIINFSSCRNYWGGGGGQNDMFAPPPPPGSTPLTDTDTT